jgi:hypothetical protein
MILDTISEAGQRQPAWQNAAGKLMTAAESGTPAAVETATIQVERALLLSGRLRLT